jgi:hypothetical protein
MHLRGVESSKWLKFHNMFYINTQPGGWGWGGQYLYYSISFALKVLASNPPISIQGAVTLERGGPITKKQATTLKIACTSNNAGNYEHHSIEAVSMNGLHSFFPDEAS